MKAQLFFESAIVQCILAKSTYSPSICKLSLQQDLKLTVTKHINYWQLMRGHLIMGCDSKVNIFADTEFELPYLLNCMPFSNSDYMHIIMVNRLDGV